MTTPTSRSIPGTRQRRLIRRAACLMVLASTSTGVLLLGASEQQVAVSGPALVAAAATTDPSTPSGPTSETTPTGEPSETPETSETSETSETQPTDTSGVEPTPSDVSDSATGTGSPTPEPTATTSTPGGTDSSSSDETPPSTAPASELIPDEVNLPSVPPAVRDSTVSWTSAVTAALVLVLAALALVLIYRRRVTDDSSTTTSPDDATTPRATAESAEAVAGWQSDQPHEPGAGPVAFLVALGQAMIDSGASVAQVQATLRRVARVNGLTGTAVAVLPTALFVSVPGTESVQTSIASAGGVLRLHQIEAVFRVVDAAEHGELGPREGLAQIEAARTMTSPFSVTLRLLGYALLTVGLVLILNGGWLEVVIAGALGTATGALQLRSSQHPSAYPVFLPVGAAFGVSIAAFLLARAGLDVGMFPLLVAPLVTFLPGALLTTAVIELATGQMISGAGRLAQGAMQLVLLALGIVTAAQLVGIPAASISSASAQPLGVLAPWLGVAVFGIGVVLGHASRSSSLLWILVILYVAYAGQLIGGLLLGSQLSAFTGALVMTPVAMMAASQRSGPPTLVTFLPAFWLLVPGAIGLAGVTKYLGDEQVDGITSLVSAGSTMLGIAFGVLLGLAAGSWLGLGSGVSIDEDAREAH